MAAPTTAGKTINVFGKKIPRTPALIVGGGAVTYIGYRWWQSGTQAPVAAPVEELPEPVDEPEDDPGFSVTGGGPPPSTNAEWNTNAIDRLIQIGIDGIAAQSAIGKFIARKPLNKVEAELVRNAVAAAGWPPENGPWVIIEEQTGTVEPGMTAPGNFTATGGVNTAQLSWNAVPGASGYQTRLRGLAWGPTTTSLSQTVPFPPQRRATRYTFDVRAIGPTGTGGPTATATTTVQSSGGGGGTGGLSQPGIQTDVRRTSIGVRASGAGATHYYLTRVGGGRGVKKNINSIHTSRGLRPGRTYTYRVRLAKGRRPNEVLGPVLEFRRTTDR